MALTNGESIIQILTAPSADGTIDIIGLSDMANLYRFEGGEEYWVLIK